MLVLASSLRYTSETGMDYQREHDSIDRDAAEGTGGHRHWVVCAHGHEGPRQSDFELDKQPAAERRCAGAH